MIKELYIYLSGGAKQSVDIDSEFNIVRNYTTPYFKDATQVINDGTYSVKLPITENNAAIFWYLDREDMATSIPYDYLYADYFVDGLTIFTNAEVKVLSVDEDFIEVQFVYGISRNTYLPLFETKLNEIPYSVTYANWVVDWNRSDMFVPYQPYKYLDYISGERISDTEVIAGVEQSKIAIPEPMFSSAKEMTMHPFMPTEQISNLIEDYTSIDLNRNTTFESRIANKGIILSTRREGYVNEVTVGITSDQIYGGAYNEDIAFSSFTSSFDQIQLKSASPTKIEIQSNYIFEKKVIVNISITDSTPSDESRTTYLVLCNGDERTLVEVPLISSHISGSLRIYDREMIDYEINAEFIDGLKIYTDATAAGGGLTINTFTTTFKYNQPFFAYYPNTGYYNCLENLPNISMYDFFAQMLIHTCGFIGYDTTNNNALKIYFLETIGGNIETGNYYDWTGRISRVTKGEFQFNSNAKNNYIKFNNDKDLFQRAENIVVLDNTIQTEQDLYILPFDSPQGLENEIADCVMYKQTVKRSGGISEDGVDFQNEFEDKYIFPFVKDVSGVAQNINIIESNYDIYKKLVKRPIIKEVEINLGYFESAQIDFSKPVYVGEWGKYCMILEVQASDDEVSVVKLLIINEPL